MAKQTINIGTSANDGTGSTLREAFDITNDNFTELYDGTGGLLHKIEGTNFTGSLLVGHSTTGTLSSAENNTGIGINSLKSITSGDANIGLGGRTGFNLTTGSRNILVGYRTGENITTGSFNVAIGDEALFTEDENGKNIAIGYHALRAQDAGVDAQNVAIGHQAGKSITTGSQNTMIGSLAADALTSGTGNVALGWASLSSETTGNRNTAVGWKSLQQLNNTGTAYNVAFGYEAGLSISTGIRNTILGGQAGNDLTTGSNNTIIGYDATASAVDVSNEVTIGNSSIANVRIPSDSTLKIGVGGDLQLEHVSSNSFIKNTAVGDLYIENQVDDKDIIFRSDNGSGGLMTYLTIDGSAGLVNLPDNIPLSFGTNNDLQIQHNAGASLNQIDNINGDLYIQQNANDKDIIFRCDDGSGGLATYITIDGSAERTKFSKNILFTNNTTALFGNDGDLSISHNGTDSVIDNFDGDLYITNKADDKDVIFRSDDGSGGFTTYFFLDGSSTQVKYDVNLKIHDSKKLIIGDGDDLQMFHSSGTNIIDSAVGDLIIKVSQDDGDIIFQSDNGSGAIATYFRLDGGDVRTEFEQDIYLNDDVRLRAGTGGDFSFFHDGSNSKINNNTGNIVIENFQDDGDIIFKNDDGSGGTVEYFKVDGSNEVISFTKGPKLFDDVKLNIGNASDLRIFHETGSTSKIENYTGNLVIQQRADDSDIVFQCDDGSGGLTEYLRLDGSTTSMQASKNIVFADDIRSTFGGGADMAIYHNSASQNGIIENFTNDLIIQNNANDEDIVFKSDDGSGGVTEYFRIDGSSVQSIISKPFRFLDSVQAIFGTGNDLEISHNGTHSFITNANGDLTIANYADDRSIYFQNDDGSGGSTNYIQLDGSEVSTKILTQKVIMSNLPTSDPSNAGQLYNDSGVLKVSAG